MVCRTIGGADSMDPKQVLSELFDIEYVRANESQLVQALFGLPFPSCSADFPWVFDGFRAFSSINARISPAFRAGAGAVRGEVQRDPGRRQVGQGAAGLQPLHGEEPQAEPLVPRRLRKPRLLGALQACFSLFERFSPSFQPLLDAFRGRCLRNRIVGGDEKTVFEQWRIPVTVQPLNRYLNPAGQLARRGEPTGPERYLGAIYV